MAVYIKQFTYKYTGASLVYAMYNKGAPVNLNDHIKIAVHRYIQISVHSKQPVFFVRRNILHVL